MVILFQSFRGFLVAFLLILGSVCIPVWVMADSDFGEAANKPLLAEPVESVDAININTADVELLAKSLKGIGMKKAQAIVDFRALHGPFKSLEEITQVKGIGASTIEKNKNVIVF